MTETRKHHVKSRAMIENDIHSLQSGKSIFTSVDVVHPVFGGQLKRPDAQTVPTHDQIAERAYGLWQEDGSLSDQEESCWLKAEVELTGEALKQRKEGIWR